MTFMVHSGIKRQLGLLLLFAPLRSLSVMSLPTGDDIDFDALTAAACGAQPMDVDSCDDSSSQGVESEPIGMEVPDDAMLFSNDEMKVYLKDDQGKVAVDTSAFGRNDCLTNSMLKAMSGAGVNLLRRHLPLQKRDDLCKQVRRSARKG